MFVLLDPTPTRGWHAELRIKQANRLFVSTELTYKPWLKVLLTDLMWEKNIVQAVDYKPDTSE